MVAVLAKARTSAPLWKLAVILMMAPVRFVSSTSLTVIVVVIGVAAWFSRYGNGATSRLARAGASLTDVTLRVRVGRLLPSAPSVTWNSRVRAVVLGCSLLL